MSASSFYLPNNTTVCTFAWIRFCPFSKPTACRLIPARTGPEINILVPVFVSRVSSRFGFVSTRGICVSTFDRENIVLGLKNSVSQLWSRSTFDATRARPSKERWRRARRAEGPRDAPSSRRRTASRLESEPGLGPECMTISLQQQSILAAIFLQNILVQGLAKGDEHPACAPRGLQTPSS